MVPKERLVVVFNGLSTHVFFSSLTTMQCVVMMVHHTSELLENRTSPLRLLLVFTSQQREKGKVGSYIPGDNDLQRRCLGRPPRWPPQPHLGLLC